MFAQDRPNSAQLGVGLALVKNLVELHGGRVQVASRGLEEGAIFTVTLRAAASGVVAAGANDIGAARAANLQGAETS